MTGKICTKCGIEKDLTSYHPDKRNKNGLSACCRDCYSNFRKIHYQNNKDKYKERLTIYRTANRDKCAQWARKSNYGITEEQYQQMVLDQENKCAFCKKESHRTLYVDHCHITGLIRRLLCNTCNVAYGLGKEDPSIFEAMRLAAIQDKISSEEQNSDHQ